MAENIIIDGCDVSGCEWIREVGLDSEYICTCNSPNKTSGYCKDNPNCHYKQLKRKEQECEELKAEIKHYKQIAQYHGNLSVKYTNKSAKYKQTLTKIKEIADKDFRHTAWEEYAKQLKQILQKISEVEECKP